jgi:competence protein ComEA
MLPLRPYTEEYVERVGYRAVVSPSHHRGADVPHEEQPSSEGHLHTLEEDVSRAVTLKLALALPGQVSTKRRYLRVLVSGLLILLLGGLYYLWQDSTPVSSPVSSMQALDLSTPVGQRAVLSTAGVTPVTGLIQVYIVGAVRRPGVYTLAAGSRVYQLLKAAGGPLPGADLVALNLAALLSDGEEIYVARVGERPPVSASNRGPSPSTAATSVAPPATGLVNINTADVSELRQRLHVSARTAQNIVSYRQTHGPYTAIDQLLEVVSRSIYEKIRGQVTV